MTHVAGPPRKSSGLLVTEVTAGSIAAELEIEVGDRVLAINGTPLRDLIDYQFLAADDHLTVEVVKTDGELWELEIEREPEELLGLVFAPPEPDRCGNRCQFCFVHQLPMGLRAPLYVKDEDYRLSFLLGNYVTLANIGPEDLVRIREQRLSPLYVSVHATNPELREALLGRTGLVPVLHVLQELARARITIHSQVVLCPGLNDGAELQRTVADLAGLHPWVASLAIVPVGLTRHRRGLPKLQPVDRGMAVAIIDRWEPAARELEEKLGGPFLFLADEFYLKARRRFPPLENYGDLPQLENGVGMVPLFLSEAKEVLAAAEPLGHQTITIVTGRSPLPFLRRFLRRLGSRTGMDLRPVAVPNRLFGRSVTVTGLVAGRDIIAALAGRELGEFVVVPDVMLKEGEGVFLDDVSVAELEMALGRPVKVAESTPAGLYRVLRD